MMPLDKQRALVHPTGSARPDAPVEVPPERTPNPEAEDGKPMISLVIAMRCAMRERIKDSKLRS